VSAANEDGEIVVMTPGLFTGYWNNPDATRSSLDDQRWFKTGSLSLIIIIIIVCVCMYI